MNLPTPKYLSVLLLTLGVLVLSFGCAMRTTSSLQSVPISQSVPTTNMATEPSGKVLVRLKEFEFGKDWSADFEITNSSNEPVFYVGSKDKYRFAYCTLAAKHLDLYLNISFKIRDICYESTFLALQTLQPGETIILAVEKQDVRDLLRPTDAYSEIKAQIGFEVFLGQGKRREIVWTDEVTFPRSERL